MKGDAANIPIKNHDIGYVGGLNTSRISKPLTYPINGSGNLYNSPIIIAAGKTETTAVKDPLKISFNIIFYN